MNVTKWITSMIMGKKVPAIPIMTHPGIELSGMTVYDAVTDGEKHFKAIKALNDRFPQAEACTVIMDLTVEAEAFGARLVFAENEVPSVTGRFVSCLEEIREMEIPSLDRARVPEYLKANRLAAENMDKPVFAGCIGPYSLGGRLYDMTEIMMGIYTEPDTVRLLLEKCTAFILDYCKALKECGTAGVIIAEPAAGLLQNDDCMQYSSVYVRQIIEAVQDDSFAVILHNCGNSGHCTEAMVATGAKGYHFGNMIDMAEAIKGCPADTLAMGNIDPVGIFRNASPQEVAAVTEELLKKTAGYPNFVISTGCDTPPQIPFENIEAFYNTVGKYNESLMS